MGLFGLFYTTFALGVRSITSCKNCIENENRRQSSIRQGKETYIDETGCERLVSNNQKVMKTYIYKKTPYGEYKDYVLKRVGSNEIIRNYSAEERSEEENSAYNKSVAEGRTTYRLGSLRDNYMKTNMPGCRYKDIKTGAIYVIRQFNGVRYYMDIKTGYIIRKTDGQLKREKDPKSYKFDKEEYHEMIRRINEEQRKYFEKHGKADNRSSYCNGFGGDFYEY